jgi:hypothetical protein
MLHSTAEREFSACYGDCKVPKDASGMAESASVLSACRLRVE